MAQYTNHQGKSSSQRSDMHHRDTDVGWRNEIRFTPPQNASLNPELFNSIAHREARRVGLNENQKTRNENKRTQLRRFYDEICMWEERVSRTPDKFNEILPFILMMNAKAAYAEGRKPKLVDQTFVDLLQHTLSEVKDAKTLTICKLFWEAFMGFYRQVRQD